MKLVFKNFLKNTLIIFKNELQNKILNCVLMYHASKGPSSCNLLLLHCPTDLDTFFSLTTNKYLNALYHEETFECFLY